MMKKMTLAVLFGGCSTEYSVSLESAHAVLTHLDPARFAVLPVGITREGAWRLYRGPLTRIADGTWCEDTANSVPCAFSPDRGSHALLTLGAQPESLHVDAAFPVLHGKNGEDGTVQGLLELAGIPLIGCGTAASALCMDKDRAHKLAALAGVRVPQSAVFARGADFTAIAQAAGTLGYPVFVKPVRAGSSFGVGRVTQPDDLRAAVDAAFAHDEEILLEEAIPGFEVGCAVLGNDTLQTGRVDEIELAGGFFDYTEKYNLISSRIHCPARIAPAQEDAIRQAACTVYRALGCRVCARVDFFLTPAGEIVFNEVNTIPGFTAHSRYPGMMRAAGLDFPTLLTRLVELGVGV